jgi:hypothetical protein
MSDALADAGVIAMPIPATHPDHAPILHVVPFQWLALGWAERQGLVPGEFRFASEVVTSEGAPPAS